MVNPDHSFQLEDYCVFAVTILVSLGIGLYFALSGGKQRTTSEYFVGNRQMSIIPVAISLMVSFESSIMMLGVPAEVYVYGFQWMWGKVGFFIANMIAIVVIVPLIHPLKITSVYEYLELRFESRGVRTLGTVLGMMSYTCYMGIVLFGPAIALEGVTGFPQWASILAVSLASVIYTAIGGLKAVIWTDVFQCFIMFSGVFAVLIKGTMHVGGIGKTWEIANDGGRINMYNFDPDPTVRHTFWSLFFGSLIRGIGLVFNQSSVQRISSTPTVTDAKKVMFILSPGFVLSLGLAGVEGIIAYAYYDSLGCDPLASGQISNPNQIIPYMVMDIFKGMHGMPGLFMASLFSASLSTLSSGLSSMSALFFTDLIKPHVKPMSEIKATIISKLSVVAFGILAAGIAFMISLIGGTLTQIAGSLLSAFGGPLTGMFFFAAFCPWGNTKGVLVGTVIATITTFTVSIGQMTTKGAVKNQRLPPAPIDFCPAVLGWGRNLLNTTHSGDWMNSTEFGTTTDYFQAPIGYVITEEPTGFSRLFMMSYQWFGAFAILQVIVIGTIVSFCTGRKMPGEVKRKYVVSLFDSLCPYLPECLLKSLRCGYHNKDDIEDTAENGEIEYIKIDKDDERYSYKLDVVKPDDTEETNKALSNNDVNHGHIIANGNSHLPSTWKSSNEVETPPESNNHTNDTSGDLVIKSVDNLTVATVPVRDIEYEIVRIGKENDAISNDEREHNGHLYITYDKMENGNVLKFRSQSMELNIDKRPLLKERAELPDIKISPPQVEGHLTEKL